MRTTIKLDDDVAKAIEQVRRERGGGVSEAVNTLVRNGLRAQPVAQTFVQRTHRMGPARFDVTNIGEVLDILDADGR